MDGQLRPHSIESVRPARLGRTTFVAALTALAVVGGVPASGGQREQRTVWDGIYTETQARRGEQAYKSACSYCHRDDLTGGFFDNGVGRAPALAGPRAFDASFLERWKDLTMAELVATVAATMPQQEPASLAADVYADIVSYLLAKNGIPSGSSELPTSVEALQDIRIVTEKDRPQP